MSATPRRSCPSCGHRRVLIAVAKVGGPEDDTHRCLCRECAKKQGFFWGDAGSEDEHHEQHPTEANDG